MPNLRLTDSQVADVATYLIDLKGPWRHREGAADQKVNDDVLLDLKAVLPVADAQAELGKMNPEQKQVELGRRAINRYGCFSCHDIKGLRRRRRSAPISRRRLEAGVAARFLVHHRYPALVEDRVVPHQAPRSAIFDKGRILPPLDKLRMNSI
jgi:hypothetical protein